MDGRYSIQVSSKAEAFLTFSFVGMKTKTVPVKGRVLNVKNLFRMRFLLMMSWL